MIQRVIQQAVEAAKHLFWKRRAQKLLQKNRDLRWESFNRETLICIQADALRRAEDLLGDMEWTDLGQGTWECPECGARWKRSLLVHPPEHDEECVLGSTVSVVRHAIQHKQRVEEGR